MGYEDARIDVVFVCGLCGFIRFKEFMTYCLGFYMAQIVRS